MRYQLIFALFLAFGVSSCGRAPFNLTIPPTAATRAAFVQYVAENAPSEDAFVAVQRLTTDAIQRKNWDSASHIYRAYEPNFPAMKARFDTIIGLLNVPDQIVKVTDLGDSINTVGNDAFLPVITVDDTKLYFCQDNPGTNDDVIVSDHIATEGPKQWSKAQHVPPPIFTTQSEAPTGVSPEGSRLLLFGNYLMTEGGSVVQHSAPGTLAGKANLFYSDKQPNGTWGPVKAFPWPINSGYYESDAKLSSDGKELFFVSDRPGAIGGFHPKPRMGGTGVFYHGSLWGNTDIYVSLKQPDGSWATPINLGPTINTPFAERTPFLHPDGKTLYFSSEGHAGLGGLNIYKSTRLSDTSWTEWSRPVNLGKEINTAGADWGYVLSTDGTTAYLAVADRKSHLYTIRSMTIPKEIRPDPVVTIAGTVTDQSGKPLAAIIKWDDLETGKNVGEISSDPVTGHFFIPLPKGRNYGYYAQKDGYFPASMNVDLRKRSDPDDSDRADTLSNLNVKIVLSWIKALQASDSAIRLNNIFFNFDKASLKPESFPELNRLAAILKIAPVVHVEIDAHTDNKGSHQYNLQLSKRRAESVVEYLIGQGIASARLTSHGFAETRPIATNSTDEGRALNRRVEFRFPRDNVTPDGIAEDSESASNALTIPESAARSGSE